MRDYLANSFRENLQTLLDESIDKI